MMQPEYQVYIRNDWPLPFVQPWGFGPTNLAKPPFRWDLILVTNLGDKYAWCYYAKSLFKIGHAIDKYLANPGNLKKFKAQAKSAETHNRKFVQKVARTDVSALPTEQLADLLRQWYGVHCRFTAAFMPIDATDETLEQDIREEIGKANIHLSVHDLAALLTPDVPTYVQREHRDFCLLTKRHAKHPASPSAARAIAEHEHKWWWTVMGWGQHKPLDAKAIRKNLAKVKDVAALLEKQKQEERTLRQTLANKRRIMRKLPNGVKRLLAAFEVLAEMHDTRKEIQMKSMHAGFGMTEQLLKRHRIPLTFRNFMLVEEYLGLANDRLPSMKELKARTRAYWCAFSSGKKMQMLSGTKALARIRQSGIAGTSTSQDGTIQGMSASPGIARGRARVELNAVVMNRTIKPGDILVTSQTTPEFAPAMKKAAAIVTDEGGITSHAAIVSRELKKPCVIGTKVATQVLKDGDMVEVDATKGIVTKL